MNPSGVMLTLTGDPKSAKSFLKVRRKNQPTVFRGLYFCRFVFNGVIETQRIFPLSLIVKGQKEPRRAGREAFRLPT